MVNSKKIKAKARELGLSQADIAKAMGLKQSTVNQKINNARPMSLREAEVLADTLQISDEEFAAYFFSNGVA